MSYINNIFELFSALFRSSMHFVSVMGLCISVGLIGGLVSLIKRMVYNRSSSDE